MFSLSPASQDESIRQFQNEGNEQKNVSGLFKYKKGHFGDNLEILTIVYVSGKCFKLITFPECGNCIVVICS